jgi:hypothetical protein
MSDRERNQSQLGILSKKWLSDRNAMIGMSIHNIRVNGIRVGIYGAEVCQLCGEVKTFSGWAAAMFLHVGNSGFSCADCCRVCCAKVLAEPDNHVDRHWLCQDCRNVIDSTHPLVSPEDVLGNLVRVRHVWLTCQSAEELERFGVRIEATRRALEEIMAGSEGK